MRSAVAGDEQPTPAERSSPSEPESAGSHGNGSDVPILQPRRCPRTTAVARDESRHVSFGIKVLQEAVRENPERFAPLIQRTLVECLPLVAGTLDPPDPAYITGFGHTESEILQFAMDSLNKKLRAIGIHLAA